MPATPETHLFTSESVTQGHPDKVADQISDAVLDAYLARDPTSRVACECLVATDQVVVAGEVSSSASLDLEPIVRRVIRKIGYEHPGQGFSANESDVRILLHEQAAEIAAGVDTGGAGDQGLMFGYACDETPELMPTPIALSHRLTRRLAEARESGELSWLRPDGKSQVTIEYRNGQPHRVDAVVVSCQHDPDINQEEIHAAVRSSIIDTVVPVTLRRGSFSVFINPTGSFSQGGPAADCGLTGRKIIVDTYGGAVPHGGGAFSGKDPTKVDRSAAYMARHVAKALVTAGLARKVVVQLAYAIGVVDPVSVFVHSYGTGEVSNPELTRLVQQVFPLSPRGIMSYLDLSRPIYGPTASYGHFGRTEPGFSWEEVTEAARNLRDAMRPSRTKGKKLA
ncbi:MAG: methionine adenosyltransferase [bacterium]|nr:methionine adenosyltransferase [bacterium]